LKPRDSSRTQTNTWPKCATHNTIYAKENKIIRLNARIAARVKTIASHILSIQIEQILVVHNLMIAFVVVYFKSLVTYEHGQLVQALEKVVFDFVEQCVSAKLGVLLRAS
jgi:hypothetical protein